MVWVLAGYLLAVTVMNPLGMLISLAILMAATMPALPKPPRLSFMVFT
jgi:hypothetical protein